MDKQINKQLFFISAGLIFFLLFWTNPEIKTQGTVKIWDRNKILLYESAEKVGRKNPVTFDKFPKDLIDAVVVTEDESFWDNYGVDVGAVVRAFFQNLTKGEIVSGGSTITQQLARYAVINDTKPNRSIIRKIREMLIALRINLSFSKQKIITTYLNEMYFGNLSYGVQSASWTYFGKDISQLSLAESAFLAGLLSAPNSRDPFTDFSRAKQRQEQVLGLMLAKKYINREEAASSVNEKITLTKKSSDLKAPHFVRYVLDRLSELNINSGNGLNVYTTLDLALFEFSEKIGRKWVSDNGKQHGLTNIAVVLLDNKTGEILNMLGGVDYYDTVSSGQVNMSTALRQPGSAIKPITYAVSFMKGYTPATLIYDVKKVYLTKKNEGYTPNNYDGIFHGPVLAREALASSLNLPAVEMLNRIGLSAFIKTAQEIGLKSLKDVGRYDLSITLGGGEVSLLELTNAYAGFARRGVFKDYYAIEKVTDDGNRILYRYKNVKETPVFGDKSPEIAYLISDILSDPKARMLGFGEKNPLVLSHNAAVKTGTTTDWHDNWTVGYTPSFTVGVWAGNNDNRAMKNLIGVTGAAPIWNQFFEEVLKGKINEEFERPENIIEKTVCKISGFLDDGLCPEKITEKFIAGTEPTEFSNFHKKVLIDIRNNLLANGNCRNGYISEKILVEYPSALYSWARDNRSDLMPKDFSPFCLSTKSLSYSPFIAITSPKNKTVYENAPEMVANQKIVFEANVSSDIVRIDWILNGKSAGSVNVFPFALPWPPVTGSHILKAVAYSKSGIIIESEQAEFKVVGYKDNY